MTEYVDVTSALAAAGPRIRWSVENQLQANLVSLEPDAVVDEHTERELDVLLVVVAAWVATGIAHQRRQRDRR